MPNITEIAPTPKHTTCFRSCAEVC